MTFSTITIFPKEPIKIDQRSRSFIAVVQVIKTAKESLTLFHKHSQCTEREDKLFMFWQAPQRSRSLSKKTSHTPFEGQ